jgi:3-phenylpropionate/cinnamic acid dioxygenase small subunit
MRNTYAAARAWLPVVVLTVSSAWAGAAAAGGVSTLLGVGAESLSLEARVRQLEDEATIRRQLEDYMGLLRSRDWDNYIKMFAKASPELRMAEGTVIGRDAIRTRMDNASKRMATAAAAANRPQLQRADLLSDVRVQVAGDSAAARSRFTFLGEQPDGTFRVTGSGIYTDTWVREEGEWRIKSRTVDWDLLAGASAAGAQNGSGAQGAASPAPSGAAPAKRN